MSLWMNRQDPCGKSSTYLVEVPFETIVIAAAMMVTVLAIRYVSQPAMVIFDAAVLGVLGFAFFFASKVSLFVRGEWITWGPASMTKPFKVMYIAGYILMAVGAIGGVAVPCILESLVGW